jgi:hypothetical protein
MDAELLRVAEICIFMDALKFEFSILRLLILMDVIDDGIITYLFG